MREVEKRRMNLERKGWRVRAGKMLPPRGLRKTYRLLYTMLEAENIQTLAHLK